MLFFALILLFSQITFCLESKELKRFPVPIPDGFISLNNCNNKQVVVLLQEAESSEFVITLPYGIVVNDGGIITADGKIFKDTETYKQDQHALLNNGGKHDLFDNSFFDGRLAVISCAGQENWYHWLLQVLPRLKILVDSQVPYDKIYVSNLVYDWQKKSLEAVLKKLKINDNLIYAVNGDSIIQARELIVPSVPFIPSRERRALPEWLITFFHETFLTMNENKTLPEHIYISRSKARIRRLGNEEKLVKLLAKKGIITIHLEDLSPYDQASIFHNAKTIIAPHGSGLANLIFSQPNTCVIEIDHEVPGQEQRSCFPQLCRYSNCIYKPFYVDMVEENQLETDMLLDLVAFEKFCAVNLPQLN
jgi:capsular polysaccharide biosynthesis protein